jgi:hypothetical protein
MPEPRSIPSLSQTPKSTTTLLRLEEVAALLLLYYFHLAHLAPLAAVTDPL